MLSVLALRLARLVRAACVRQVAERSQRSRRWRRSAHRRALELTGQSRYISDCQARSAALRDLCAASLIVFRRIISNSALTFSRASMRVSRHGRTWPSRHSQGCLFGWGGPWSSFPHHGSPGAHKLALGVFETLSVAPKSSSPATECIVKAQTSSASARRWSSNSRLSRLRGSSTTVAHDDAPHARRPKLTTAKFVSFGVRADAGLAPRRNAPPPPAPRPIARV